MFSLWEEAPLDGLGALTAKVKALQPESWDEQRVGDALDAAFDQLAKFVMEDVQRKADTTDRERLVDILEEHQLGWLVEKSPWLRDYFNPGTDTSSP